ncbi:hypothetical protein PP742_gp55 [Alcaligenes phage vB_Af_QDWS595]|uniref:Uncharacterized protein n=1 Tax=Alcaligenes phage vB_Af_QDWS595 TaxID=2877946 RepID=A0AAE9BZY4_9CAUD|nr:hypothetical protein PP742_gp55 [Alcaligenes phage vB_Af_QDWS595]UCR75539.1 hypothetical protein vBAfaPQDWS595_55 [Alcaligenes phage vB_Af_QDWS595]
MNNMMRDRKTFQQNIFDSQPSSQDQNRGWSNGNMWKSEKPVFKDRVNLRMYRSLRKEGLSPKQAQETVKLLTGATPNG